MVSVINTGPYAEAMYRVLFGGDSELEGSLVHQTLAETYGPEMVQFSTRTFNEVLQDCTAQKKPLFLYIHDDSCPVCTCYIVKRRNQHLCKLHLSAALAARSLLATAVSDTPLEKCCGVTFGA